jgi:lipid-A-disaccharide synthase
MLVVFKFEEDFYRHYKVSVDFVGHPLMDILADYENKKQELLKMFSLKEEDKKIALLPGSRENEVKYILPIMLRACAILQTKIKNTKFLLCRSHTVKKEIYLEITKKYKLNNLIYCDDKTYDSLCSCDFALVCSGTATLETAIFLKPMAIIYKMSFLSYLIIRLLIKIPYIGLVNLISQKKIVPEFIQFNAKPQRIATFALEMLTNVARRQEIEDRLREVRKKLGPPGASQRAAKIILDVSS